MGNGTVVFDLDGTLADTSGDLLAAANHCFRSMGLGDQLDAGVAADRAVAFRGGRAMLTEGLRRAGRLDEDVVTQYFPRFISAYGAAIDVHTVLYPGAMEAVAALRAAGMAVGICTNKPEGLAQTLLERLGVRGEFGALIGADTLPVRKPHPQPLAETVARLGGRAERACLIGDTITDRDTARALGVPVVLVTFGPEGEAVSALKPDALLHDYAALPDIVVRLFAEQVAP
ncbi:HAD-IA family hydrolase [Poseidonocella sedimentorum]|nr:HAD-IA family hydrolase [Poseidonocella sedimentorum]